MPTFQNKLDELLADAVLASGIPRAQSLDAVRTYLRITGIDQLRREIAQLTSLQELTMLLGAGVPASLQDQFHYQRQHLLERSGLV